MSEPVVASGDGKPRIRYEDFKASSDAAWMEAFAKVEAMGVGAKLGDWKITMLGGGIHPAWVQVKNKAGHRMVRRGDPMIHELLKASAKSNDRNSTKERT